MRQNPTTMVAEAWSLMDSGKRREALYALWRAVAILSDDLDESRECGRRVVCRTNPKRWWPNIKAAADALGVKSRTAITTAIERGGTCRGVYLRYEDTPEEDCPPMQSKAKAVKANGRVYPSIVAAAAELAPPELKPGARFMWMSRRLIRDQDLAARGVGAKP